MSADHVDVLIVGAGLSGIGAACRLRQESPRRTFTILEARDAIGGTWDLFRYPGVRSDSDMFTLGYEFHPWQQAKAIADGDSIRAYVRETAREFDVDRQIRFHHKVVRAEWSTQDAQWTVYAERSDTGETVQITCAFLYTCTGYYRYDEGYTPEFAGREDFAGQIVHPQHWPEGFDYTGKRIVVIGSGATAVTLVPSMAETAEHVTMVQRSPSYVLTLPSEDPIVNVLRGRLPAKVLDPLVRWKNVLVTSALFQLSRRAPKVVRSLLRKLAAKQLPAGYDVDTHFRPDYDPWDQRMCFVPDGDLFAALRHGTASIATGGIDRFTERGVLLASGEELPADVIVTATGLNVLAVGGIDLLVDGRAVVLRDTVAYKGMMLSDVPNFALTIGYTNASWTLKADLVSRYVCRLLNHMDAHGYQICVPELADRNVDTIPLIDLKSGYVLRSLDLLPRQGPAAPWRLYQNYPRDVLLMRYGPVEGDGMRFATAPAKVAQRSAV